MKWYDTSNLQHALHQFMLRRGPLLVLLLLNFLIYFKTVTYYNIGLDDNALIDYSRVFADNKHIANLFSEEVIPGHFNYFYRPILMLSFYIDNKLHTYIPFTHHTTNIIIHLIASCLLYSLLKIWHIPKPRAIFLACIFTVHPALTSAVAWIPGRNDSLLGLFIFASFIQYDLFLSQKRLYQYVLHIIFFMAALFTKETAIAILPMLLLYPALFMKNKKPSAQILTHLVLGWITTMAVWVYLKFSAGIDHGGNIAIAFSYDKVKIAIPAILQYLGKALIPIRLTGLGLLQTHDVLIGVFTLVIITTLLIFFSKKNNKIVVFGALWFLIFLIPVIVTPAKLLFEHRLYVPIVGLLVVINQIRFKSLFNKSFIVVFQAICISVLGLCSYAYSDVFLNSIVFWKNAAKTYPSSDTVHNGYGNALFYYKQFSLAEHEYWLAYQLSNKQDKSIVASARNVIRLNLTGNMPKAERVLKEMTALQPQMQSGEIWYLYGEFYELQKKLPQAEKCYREAMTLNRYNISIYFKLCKLYELKNDKKHYDILLITLKRIFRNERMSIEYYNFELEPTLWFHKLTQQWKANA